jgi:tetratricopeptide (TPR) repeat protein
VQLGFAHLQLEAYDRAIAEFEQARAISPDDPSFEAYVIRAQIAGRLFAQAADRARQARLRHPDEFQLARLEAQARQQGGEPEEGIAILKEAVTRNADDPDAHVALAELYAGARRMDEAEAVLRTAGSAFPRDTSIPFQLGAVFEQQKRYAEAERAFREVLARDPRHAPALNYLGYMLADRGERLEESVELIQRALEIDPENGAYLDSLGWAYFKLNRLDLAEANLRKAGEQLRTSSVVQDHLGDVLARLGRHAEAIAAWERSLAGDGESIDRAAIQRKIGAARGKAGAKPSR